MKAPFTVRTIPVRIFQGERPPESASPAEIALWEAENMDNSAVVEMRPLPLGVDAVAGRIFDGDPLRNERITFVRLGFMIEDDSLKSRRPSLSAPVEDWRDYADFVRAEMSEAGFTTHLFVQLIEAMGAVNMGVGSPKNS